MSLSPSFMKNAARRLIPGISILFVCLVCDWSARAEEEAPKKSGFFSRIADLVKKKEKEPEPEKPAAKENSPSKGDSKPAGTKTTAKTGKSTAKSNGGDDPPAKSKSTVSATKKSSTSSEKKDEPKTSTKEPAKKSSDSSKSQVAKKEPEPAPKKKSTTASSAGKGGKSSGKSSTSSKTASTNGKGSPSKPETEKTGAKKDEPAKADDQKKVADTKENDSSKSADVKKDNPASDEKKDENLASASAPAAQNRPMGGFAPGDERAMDVTSSSRSDGVSTSGTAKLTEPSDPSAAAPLPPGKGAGWEIVKYEGRDYVTADSMLNFYRVAGLTSYKLTGSQVWFRGNNLILKAQVGSMEMLINNVKFILSYPVAERSGKALFSRIDLCKLIDPVLRPSYITGADPFNTVVLDAGHGGHDSGAKGVYGYEKDFTLQMALTTKASLEKRGFRVILTRAKDEFISRTGRVALANATPNSIFISLHFNSAGPAATGIETFALTPIGASASLERGGGYNANGLTGNRRDSENIALATAIHARVVSTYKLIDRGIKRAQWTVLTGCDRPGILFEGGFVTNGGECRLIASETYRRALAETIADGVVNYRSALQPPNMVRRR